MINFLFFFQLIKTEPDTTAEPVITISAVEDTKKPIVAKTPKPGKVHIATALDGSTLFCCPECQMGYTDKSLLEHHLLIHKVERR